jgi:hypothetical protein
VEAPDARRDLLTDLADGVRSWSRAAEELVRGRAPDWLATDEPLTAHLPALVTMTDVQRAAVAAVVRHALEGVVHSALVVLDGGAHRCPTLDLRDPSGRSLGVALHEEWPDFAPSEHEQRSGR